MGRPFLNIQVVGTKSFRSLFLRKTRRCSTIRSIESRRSDAKKGSKYFWCGLLASLSLAACSRPLPMQSSVSIEAYRLDEATKNVFVETNPCRASFSILPGPVDNDVCSATVRFKGFPKRKNYLLFCLNTADPTEPIAMYPITLEGSSVITRRKNTEEVQDHFDLRLVASPGFQSTWYLWAEDESLRLCRSISPSPLYATSSDGVRMKIIRKEAGGNIADIYVTGLKEAEQICFVFRSMNNEAFYPCKAPANGTIKMPLYTSVAGIQSATRTGTTTVLLVRDGETLKLSCDWDLSTTQVPARRR